MKKMNVFESMGTKTIAYFSKSKVKKTNLRNQRVTLLSNERHFQ